MSVATVVTCDRCGEACYTSHQDWKEAREWMVRDAGWKMSGKRDLCHYCAMPARQREAALR